MSRDRGAPRSPAEIVLAAKWNRIAEVTSDPETDPAVVYAATIEWERQAAKLQVRHEAGTSPRRTTTRSRESHRTRPGQRRSRRTSAARSPDDDSGPGEPPPPLPWRIAGPADDNRGVESAFLSILTRRHPGKRWEVSR